MKQTINYIIIFAAIVILSSAAYSSEHMNETVSLTAEQIQDNKYELICEADFTASNYEWNLGDSNQTLASLNNIIEYEFAPGNHEISCTAFNLLENMSGTASYMLNVFQPIMLVNESEPLMIWNETENMSNETNVSMTNESINLTENMTNTTNTTNNETWPLFNYTENETTLNLTNQTQVNETGNMINETNRTSERPVVPIFQNETSLKINYNRVSNGQYTFQCQAEGFTPQVYDWNFGDGTTSYDVTQNNVSHMYAMPGTKTVFCGAWSTSGIYETATIRVDVADVEPQARVNVLQNNDPSFAFNCETDEFVPDTYDWDFGDGTMYLDVNDQARNHTYDRNGFFSVACTAWNQEAQRIVIGYTHINITNAVNGAGNGDMYIMREQLNNDTYRFSCITPSMSPRTYDWEVYDVYGDSFERRDHDVSYNMIEQTFNVDGKYVISCTATDLEKTKIDWQFLTIQGTNSEYMIVQETSEEEIPDHVTQLLVTDTMASVILSRESRGNLLVTVQTDLQKVIDLRDIVENNRATIPGRITFESETTERVVVTIPENTTITANGNWDGMLWLPHRGTVPTELQNEATSVIKVGSDVPLTFDKAIRIEFSNRAGESMAIERNGELSYVRSVCDDDTERFGNNLPAGESCVISVGNDLILWTKSFSQFITYNGEENTPYLDISQEQMAQRSANDERERRTMQTFDVGQNESPNTTNFIGQNNGLNENNDVWKWLILGIVVISAIAIIASFSRSDKEVQAGRRKY